MAQAALKQMTLDAFLEWDDRQELRHEFDDGEIIAMAGGTDQHDAVRGNIFAALHGQLAGRPCRVRMDLRVESPTRRVRYPDVAVDCGPRDPKATQLAEPRVVVEVLSPSTQSTDYLRKPRDYGAIPSIDTYLIVDPDSPRVVVLRRTAEGLELDQDYTEFNDVIALDVIGATLSLADIYDGLPQAS
jgi:Uma2 family endonuclease